MTEVSEKKIIEKVLGGDANAFEELVLKYEKTVYNLALRMVGDRDDASDMTQEAFIKAYGSLSSFRGDSKFSVWIYRITTNVCLDFLRSKSRKQQVSLTVSDDDEDAQLDIPDPKADPEQQLIKKISMQSVEEGLKTLPDKQRQILVMRELGGMSYAEIGAALSLEEGTVKSRIFRARKRLCTFLLDSGNIPDSLASKGMKGSGQNMIDCEKCREMISCLLDGELSQAEQSLVREHIAACPECRSVYDAFSAVSAQLHEEEPLPDGLHEKIMSGIKAKPKKKTGIVWIKYLSVAACLALVIFAGVKSGMLSPAENKVDSNDLYVAETLPVLDGRFTGQSGNGDKTTYTLAQNAKTRAAVSAETAEKLRTLLAPAEDAHSEYVVSGEADYAVSFDDGVEPDFVLIYIDDGRAYADYGNGAFAAAGSAQEIRDLLDACAGK